jgi:hypothetical protein
MVKQVYVSDNIYDYVNDLVFSTRKPNEYGIEEI